jgi:putative ATPase
MKDLRYGKGYKYAHNEDDAVADMSCLPPALEGRTYYAPRDRGFEKEIKRRLDAWDELKKRKKKADSSS